MDTLRRSCVALVMILLCLAACGLWEPTPTKRPRATAERVEEEQMAPTPTRRPTPSPVPTAVPLPTPIPISEGSLQMAVDGPCWFYISVPADSSQLVVELLPQSGQFDIHFAGGLPHSLPVLLKDTYKVTFAGPTANDFSFTQSNPPRQCAVAVVPHGGGGTFQLKISTEPMDRDPQRSPAQEAASRSGIGKLQFPLTTEVTLHVGPGFEARAGYAFQTTCPGQISAVATWAGTASQLALLLSGPGTTIVGQQGGSPLRLNYTIEPTGSQQVMRWELSLVNSGSGTAEVKLVVDYPGRRPLTACEWTKPGVSEENSPARCPDELALRGIACTGKYCDNKELYCCPTASCPTYGVQEQWSGWFSEEGQNYYLADAFFGGLACSGDYCDRLSMRTLPGLPLRGIQNCYWTGWHSEESPNNFALCQSGYYVFGTQCSGSYCDNIALRCCQPVY